MTQRPVWKVIVFGLITLGIYDLYWLYRTRLELVAKGNSVPRLRWLILPYIGIAIIFVLQFGLRFIMAQNDQSLDTVSTSDAATKFLNIASILVGIAAVPAIIVVPFIWFYKYCQAVERVCGAIMTVGPAYILWLVLNFFGVGFVWNGIIQDAYNKVSTQPVVPPSQPVALGNPTI